MPPQQSPHKLISHQLEKKRWGRRRRKRERLGEGASSLWPFLHQTNVRQVTCDSRLCEDSTEAGCTYTTLIVSSSFVIFLSRLCPQKPKRGKSVQECQVNIVTRYLIGFSGMVWYGTYGMEWYIFLFGKNDDTHGGGWAKQRAGGCWPYTVPVSLYLISAQGEEPYLM